MTADDMLLALPSLRFDQQIDVVLWLCEEHGIYMIQHPYIHAWIERHAAALTGYYRLNGSINV